MFDALDRLSTESSDLDAEEALIRRLIADFERAWPEQTAPQLPPNLEEWAADHRLAVLLDHLDPNELSDEDRVRFLRASERLVAHQQAATLAGIAAVSKSYQELEIEDAADVYSGTTFELRAALRWTQRAAAAELDLATDLLVRLPIVLQALDQGRIDRPRAKKIVDHTSHLSVAHARMVAEKVIDEAARLTTGQLVGQVRRACLDVDPDAVREERKKAVADRRLVSWAEPDGTLSVLLTGIDPMRGEELLDRINRIARGLRSKDEPRTMDQLRADVATDLLTGTSHPRLGSLHLTVDLTDLLDPEVHASAELAGYGPILGDIARRVAESGDGTWDWTVTHPGSGMPIADGHTRRRPTASQRRKLRARHRTCVAPGCRRPVVDCDIDHTKPWAHTRETDSADLAPLCRPDHCTRHQSGWSYEPLPDGDYLWIGPLGTTYTASGRDP